MPTDVVRGATLEPADSRLHAAAAADGGHQPTILIAVHQGFGTRYLLRTEILRSLVQSGARIVILAPNANEEYFRQEFARANVVLETLDVNGHDRFRLASRLQIFLEFVRLFVLSDRGDLEAIHRREIRERAKLRGWKLHLRWWISRPLVHALRRSRALRRALGRLETRYLTPRCHRSLFERHRPDVVVVTSLGYWSYDAFVMREARHHGARIVSVILSWDNPCSKGLAGAQVDHAVVWTEAMRDELAVYHDIPPERVFVGGVAHFDTYVRRDPSPDPAVTLAALGADPRRRTILFGTASPTIYDDVNRQVIEALGRAIADGQLPEAQLVVRVHPLYLGRGVRPSDGAKLEALRTLAASFPRVALDVPKSASRQLGFDMPTADQGHLRSLLAGSSVMVTVFSTVMLESAILDVPIVNVAFETWNERLQDTNRCQERLPYMKRAFSTGGVRLVYSVADLVREVRRYLDDPTRDAAGRRRLREQECGPNQGRAGETIAKFLFGLAKRGGAA